MTNTLTAMIGRPVEIDGANVRVRYDEPYEIGRKLARADGERILATLAAFGASPAHEPEIMGDEMGTRLEIVLRAMPEAAE